jgi:hypothetical protein
MNRFMSLLFVGAVAVPSVSFAQQCYTDGQSVTLTGRVQMKIIPPGPDSPPHGWKYPLLTLPATICLTSETGNKITTRTIGILASHTKTGAHVTLHGEIGSPQTGHEPPEDLLLTLPQ